MDTGFTNRTDSIAMKQDNNFYRDRNLNKHLKEKENSLQQLKAEIALCADQLELIKGTGYMVGKRADVLFRLRQLSAV